ncbi:MAG: hypothetical protein HY248_03235, partial [Fimbriimonas ginsengisoli]|nr:hypothetical protein [Fimbriimonas ginsengisoli]
LALIAALITLGTEHGGSPTTTSYAGKGASALAELLSRQGYRVETSASYAPRLQHADLVVAFVGRTESFPFKAEPKDPQGEPSFRNDPGVGFRDKIAAHVRSGGTLLVLPTPMGYWEDTEGNRIIETLDGSPSRRPLNVSVMSLTPSGPPVSAENEADTPPRRRNQAPHADGLSLGTLSSSNRTFGTATREGDGLIVRLADGTMASNRYLDAAENATALLDVVRALAPPGGRIVFAEGSFGGASEPSLMEAIGPWALAAWQQILVLFVVVIYTLGRPFGLPIEERSRESGARALVDALTGSMQRSDKAIDALRVSYDRAVAIAGRKLKARAATHLAIRDRLPEALAEALNQAQTAMSEAKLDPGAALDLARRIDDELAAFLGRAAPKL